MFAYLLVHKGQVGKNFVSFRGYSDLLEPALALCISQLLSHFAKNGKFLRVLIEEL